MKRLDPPAWLVLIAAFSVAFVAAMNVATCGCAGSDQHAAALIQKSEALAFAGAVAALEVLDARQAEHLRSIPKATPDELAKERAIVDRLERARKGLEVTRSFLAGEREGDERAELRGAVELLELAAGDMKAAGVEIPASALDGLKAAEAFTGAR